MAADKRRLKIAMVIDCFDDACNGGVISTQRFVQLLRRKHDITVVATGKLTEGKLVLPSFYPPFGRKKMQRINFVFAWPQTEKLRALFQQMDLVHVQFPFYLGIKATRIANELNVPVVSTFHVQAEHLLYNNGIRSPKWINMLYRFFVNKIYNRSTVVICPSQFAETEIKHYGLTRPTQVISNGILADYRPMAVKREERFNNKFCILSVGRFAAEKRQAIIIEAIQRSQYESKIQLILIGYGHKKEALQAKGKALTNPIEFLSLKADEIIPYYNLADLYVHAAEVEVECMTVLEAIACGLPPIIAASPKSASKQFALDQRSLFKYDDVNELTDKIGYWIEHADELANAKKRYLAFAQEFNIDKSAEKLEAVYYQALQASLQTASADYCEPMDNVS